MRTWKLWIWPGMTAIACLTILALWFTTNTVEQDLQMRVLAQLREHHAWAQVSLQGRDLLLSGQAPDKQSQAEALAILRKTYGVRTVRNRSTVRSLAPPSQLPPKTRQTGNR